jgi:hypothetical protein
MKKLLGVFVLVLAVIALLLSTCRGPTSESSGPAGEAPPASAGAPPPAPDEAPAPDADPAPEAADRQSRAARAPAAAPPPSPEERPITPQEAPPPSPEPPREAPAAWTVDASPPPLPPTPVPVERIEALLAVDTRTLEGRTVPTAGVLLVPVDTLRHRLRLPLPSSDWLPTDFTRGQPASTINTPTAYGQKWGQVSAGAAYQNRIRYDDWTDGVASVGIGLGNPLSYVGLDVSVNILDTYTEFADDRSLSLKLHRRLPYRTAVAVGHENIWHTDGTDGGSSRYLVVSKVVLLRDRPTSALGSMVLNLGVGNDRFLPEERFARGEDGVNVFGSLGVRVLPPVNAVANWTGQDLALGLSIAPVRTWPLVLTPAVVDVTGTAGDGARFSVSAGLNYTFR